jgi:hypothetical protein
VFGNKESNDFLIPERSPKMVANAQLPPENVLKLLLRRTEKAKKIV